MTRFCFTIGERLLYEACKKDNKQLLDLLLLNFVSLFNEKSINAVINAFAKDKKTSKQLIYGKLLRSQLAHGLHINTIKLLLSQSDINLNIKSEYDLTLGQQLIYQLCHNNIDQCLLTLLKANHPYLLEHDSLCKIASKLIKSGSRLPNWFGETLLRSALANETLDLKMIKYILLYSCSSLESKSDQSDLMLGQQLIYKMSSLGHKQILKLLQEKYAYLFEHNSLCQIVKLFMSVNDKTKKIPTWLSEKVLINFAYNPSNIDSNMIKFLLFCSKVDLATKRLSSDLMLGQQLIYRMNLVIDQSTLNLLQKKHSYLFECNSLHKILEFFIANRQQPSDWLAKKVIIQAYFSNSYQLLSILRLNYASLFNNKIIEESLSVLNDNEKVKALHWVYQNKNILVPFFHNNHTLFSNSNNFSMVIENRNNNLRFDN